MDSADGIPGPMNDIIARLAGLRVPGFSLAYRMGDRPAGYWTWGVDSARIGTPVTRNSLFQGGSVSKAITAFAALALVSQKRAELDEDVNDYLTSWSIPPVSGWQPRITLRMLLSHMAGIRPIMSPLLPRDRERPSIADVLEGRGGHPVPIRAEALPGLFWAYSGGGYLIVAQLVSDLTGMPFPEAARQLVFEPLGMSSSTFAQPLPPESQRCAAEGHVASEPIPDERYSFATVGETGLWSTPRDLLRFSDAVTSGKVPEMLTGQAAEPRMGLGVFLTRSAGQQWWEMRGDTPGYWCRIGGTAGGRVRFSMAAAANDAGSYGELDVLFQDLSQRLGPGRIAINNLFAHASAAWASAAADYQELTGDYVTPNGIELAVAVRHTHPQPGLNIRLPGQEPVDMLPATGRAWQIRGMGGIQVEFFSRDELRLVQYGREIRARRIRRRPGEETPAQSSSYSAMNLRMVSSRPPEKK
jgi:CubicO group peptidase (beta-lactamase class C family)